MIHFACVQCSRRHKVHESMAGATVRCPCGQMMLVPDAEVSPTAIEEMQVTCVCGNELWVPQSAIGESVRCSCGEELLVAGPVESSIPESPLQRLDESLEHQGRLSSVAQDRNAQESLKASVFSRDLLEHAQQEIQSKKIESKNVISRELEPGRWTLIVIGLLSILINIIYFININAEVTTIAQNAAAKGTAVDMALLTLVGRAFYGLAILMGFVFVALGVSVYRLPLAAPAIGLSIYGLGLILYLLLNPIAFVSPLGILVKIAIIGALVKAINSGIYYRP